MGNSSGFRSVGRGAIPRLSNSKEGVFQTYDSVQMKGSLNYPAKKKEAQRIDAANQKMAERIVNQDSFVKKMDFVKENKNQKKIQILNSKNHNPDYEISKRMQKMRKMKEDQYGHFSSHMLPDESQYLPSLK